MRKKGKGGGRNWATEQRAEAGKTGRRGREGSAAGPIPGWAEKVGRKIFQKSFFFS